MAKKKKPAPADKVENAPKSFFEIEQEKQNLVRNGLTDAIMGTQLGVGIGGGQNYVQTGIGTAQLSQTDTLYKNLRWYLISNMRQLLSEAFVELGLVQTIVEVPVDDALRGGIEITSEQLDEKEIQDLHAELERNNDLQVIGQAAKWTRLFGGGGVVIITDQDASTPLDLDAITEDSPLEFRAVDMWELFWSKQNTEDYAAAIDQTMVDNVEFYNYYGQKLHHSRVLKMKGQEAPSFVRPRLRGWGTSVVEILIRSINQYLKSNTLGFEVLDEFKLDIYKIKNLTNSLLSPGGEELIRRRVSLANSQKNYQNAITMDSEDDYVQKQLSWSGLAEAMDGIRMQVASDLRMPMSKIFGISAKGFNSGEDDIEVYNGMVESQIRTKIKRDILRVIEIRCQQMFGMIPDDLKVDFMPLRVLSALDEENVKTQKFARLIQAKQAGEITALEFRNACNRDNLLMIQLDTDEQALGEIEDAKAAMQPPDDGGGDDDEGGGKDEDTIEKGKKKNPFENSLDYDVAAYEVDGGDNQFSPWHERQFENPGKVDEGLWSKAKAASQKAFGKVKWQFVTWFYKQHGGKFQ
jgi:phage-related protein (TIGR01555 family)